MPKQHIAFIEYNGHELHPIYDSKHQWLLSAKEVALAYDISLGKLFEIQKEHETLLEEEKHYLYDNILCCGQHSSTLLLWTKKGVLRMAYYIKSAQAMDFLDFIEDIHLQTPSTIDPQITYLYDEIETTLMEKLHILKNDPNMSMEALNQLIFTLDNLAQKKHTLQQGRTAKGDGMSDIITSMMGLLKMDPDSLKQQVTTYVEKEFEKKETKDDDTKPASI